MTQLELIQHIMQHNDCNQTQAKKALKAVLSGITQCLKEGRTINLPNFGRFSTEARKARKARNMITNQIIPVAACYVPYFKASSSLKSTVKRSHEQLPDTQTKNN